MNKTKKYQGDYDPLKYKEMELNFSAYGFDTKSDFEKNFTRTINDGLLNLHIAHEQIFERRDFPDYTLRFLSNFMFFRLYIIERNENTEYGQYLFPSFMKFLAFHKFFEAEEIIGNYASKNWAELINASASCQVPFLELFLHNFGLHTASGGIFIEIGAYDGITHSNTAHLADAGWSGLYFEPHPFYYQKCKERHISNEKVQVLNLAVGSKNSEIFLTDQLTFSKVSNSGDIVAKQVVFDDFLRQINFRNQIDLLVVDVEGYEDEVFSGINLKTLNPKVIIIEKDCLNFFIDMDDKAKESKSIQLILSCGYRLLFSDGINSLFVSADT